MSATLDHPLAPLRVVVPAFTRIVIGTDRERTAELALDQGLRLAALARADVDLLHVFETGASEPGEAHSVRRRAEDLLRSAARRAEQHDIAATRHVLVGRAPEMLEHDARERWSDLICIGAGSSARLGRVARPALRRAHCSVLIARTSPRDAEFPSRILCAVDGSEGSDEAVRQAASVAALPGDASLRLLNVGKEGNGGWIAKGGRAVRRATEIARRWDLDPTGEIAVGDAAETITAVAAVWGADLIVVGSRGLHGVGRWLLGSVGEAVAGDAPCSVLVARRRPW